MSFFGITLQALVHKVFDQLKRLDAIDHEFVFQILAIPGILHRFDQIHKPLL